MRKDGGHMWYKPSEKQPKDGDVVIAAVGDRRHQVERRGDSYFRWTYAGIEDRLFSISEIDEWRGCSGFDF